MTALQTKVSLFVSYASEDRADAERLLDKLRPHLGSSRRYSYELWRDRDELVIGDDWEGEINAALERCDAGLLLLSPGFLTSEFIKNVELPALAKRALPVCLKPISERADMRGLTRLQIYGFDRTDPSRRPFTTTSGSNREDFVVGLFDSIERRLDRTLGGQA